MMSKTARLRAILAAAAAAAAAIGLHQPASAQTWDGGGANNDWTAGLNWDADIDAFQAPVFPRAAILVAQALKVGLS